MGRRLIAISLCLLIPALLIQGCRTDEPAWPKDSKIRVLTSFPPLYCFAQAVAGDDAHVVCLLTTEGPHGYEANHRDYMKARGASVFLVNGLGLDDFVTKINNSSGNPKAAFAVADTLPPEKLLRSDEAEHKHGPGEEHHHHHGEFDPHVWLSPDHAIHMVQTIANKLSTIDAKNKAGYQKRAQTYIAELKKLHAYGKTELAKKKNPKMISMHDSMRYFGQAFGVEVVDAIQVHPGMEASGGKYQQLVKTCAEKGVRVIAVEPQYQRGSAESVQGEAAGKGIKLQIAEVDPLETAPAASGSANPDPGYYLKRMYQNIDNLVKALP